MNKIIKFIVFFIIIISGQSSYSKPIPPGSGAGDVPANILFLLDNSASMNVTITTPSQSIGQAYDVIELPSDGSLIIATNDYGIVKVDSDDVIKDTTFAGTGEFKGSSAAVCNGKVSEIRKAYELEISTRVNGRVGEEVIFASTRAGISSSSDPNRIVSIDKSGNCIDVIDDTHSVWPSPYKVQFMDIRTIGVEDHLFVTLKKKAPTGPNIWGYFFTKNLTTGATKNCFYSTGSNGNTYKLRLGKSNSVTFDDGNNMYIASNFKIFKYELKKNGDNYCLDTAAVSAHTTYNPSSVPDCFDDTRHCKAHTIKIDPDDPTLMYSTTFNGGQFQSLRIEDTELIPLLPDKIKGQDSMDHTVSDSNVLFKKSINMHVTSSNIYVVDQKPSIQKFDKDDNLTWLANLGTELRRIDGAIKAIRAVVTDSSFTSGANFGYGYWNSGVGNNPDRVKNPGPGHTEAGYFCHGIHDNCDYYEGWTGSHPEGTSTLCNVNSCLVVGIHRDGHNKIEAALDATDLAWGTDANAFSELAFDYFSDPNVDVIDPTAEDCQLNYVIVISDGAWKNSHTALPRITQLRTGKKVRTLVVAYGTGIKESTKRNLFDPMAIAGSCDDATGAAEECEELIEADTPEDLKTKLASKVQQIIADRLSFTAPSVTATIQEGGALYQAQFNYEQNGEWKGTILRKTLNPDGSVNHDEDAPGNWDAGKMVKAQPSRNIWTVLPDASYIGEWNNFKTENNIYINHLFTLTGNKVLDYHNESSTCGGENGIDDDIDGLINFVRGKDYFAYGGCDNIDNLRDHVLGDIYHSQLTEVGPPSANYEFASPKEEAYWRATHNYQSFASKHASRKNIIYAGANDGMLHAFNAETGQEEWAFVPPFIASKLPTIMNPALDGKMDGGNGGSNAIFGVDGSPLVHDMLIKGYDQDGNLEATKNWHTILMIPYGRGGSGFSVLDVTHTLLPGTKGPLHMFSILNDAVNSRVLIADKDGVINSYPYVASQYKLAQSKEAIKATKNQSEAEAAGTADDPGTFTCESNTDVGGNFYQLSDNTCYKGDTFTFKFKAPSTDINKYNVFKKNSDGSKTTITPVSITLLGGLTRITFSAPEVYNASDSEDSLEKTSIITIELDDNITGVQDHDYKYDYSKLGETWSTPRIFRMPLSATSDYTEDKYVAVMGGGFGSSKLFIVNFEDENFPGSIAGSLENKGPISIIDSDDIEITNALSSTAVVITPEISSAIPWRGAMVYINDLEGKITKINLSNSTENSAELYEQTTLFKLNSSIDNGRYNYFSMDATIGQDSQAFWLYGGTGDFQRVNDVEGSMDNILFGIKDPDYPYFKSNHKVPIQNNDGWKAFALQNINLAPNIDDTNICKDTTSTGEDVSCPVETADSGWVVHLDDLANNKYRKLTGTPTVYKGRVYFPIYKPPDGGNRCSLGNAYICSDDDECGTNKSSELAENEGAEMDGEDPCFFVRAGILSELVVFGDSLYGNVAGPSETEDTLVSILAGKGDTISSNKQSWRQLGF